MSADAVADFVARAARLDTEPPRPGEPTANPRGDHDLDGPEVVPEGPHRRAAVLVPVVPRPAGLGVIFTVRSAHLRDHSGQIAFPGGKIDPGDASPPPPPCARPRRRSASKRARSGRSATSTPTSRPRASW